MRRGGREAGREKEGGKVKMRSDDQVTYRVRRLCLLPVSIWTDDKSDQRLRSQKKTRSDRRRRAIGKDWLWGQHTSPHPLQGKMSSLSRPFSRYSSVMEVMVEDIVPDTQDT